MPSPEDKESFPLCTWAGGLLGAEKMMWPHPTRSVDPYHRPLWWDQHEEKAVHACWEGPGKSGFGKRNKVRGQRQTGAQEDVQSK